MLADVESRLVRIWLGTTLGPAMQARDELSLLETRSKVVRNLIESNRDSDY